MRTGGICGEIRVNSNQNRMKYTMDLGNKKNHTQSSQKTWLSSKKDYTTDIYIYKTVN